MPIWVRLALAGTGLALIVIGILWARLGGSPPAAEEDRQIPPYEFEYSKILTDQEVRIEVSPPRTTEQRMLYLWSLDSWEPGGQLNEVRARVALSGIEAELLAAEREGHFYLRLGPFTSVSDRNNAREALIKENLRVALSAPRSRN